MLTGTLSNSYLDQVDFYFQQMIGQQGSTLYSLVSAMKRPVIGDSLKIRSHDVTEPYWADTAGGITQYGNLTYDARILQPQDIMYSIMLDEFILRKQGTEDPSSIAAMMSNKIMLFSENFIINGRNGIGGIGGKARTIKGGANETLVSFLDSNTIFAADLTLGGMTETEDPERRLRYGLSTAKLGKAYQKARSKFVTSPLGLVASEYALSTLRADPRYSNSLFNVQPGMATGQMTPYSGIQYMIPSEYVPKGIKMHKADGTEAETVTGEYAYVFALDQIVLGEGLGWNFKTMENAEREGNPVFMFKGSYDCLRMDENAVYRIEVATTGNLTLLNA